MYGPIGPCRRKLAPLSRCARMPYQTMRSALVRFRRKARARTLCHVGTRQVGVFDDSDIARVFVGLPPPYPPAQAGEGERPCLWRSTNRLAPRHGLSPPASGGI